MVKTRGLTHVALAVRDPSKAAQFYRRLLGAQVVYQVVMNETMDANDPATLQTMYPADHDILTIVTCGGTFYRTGDPVFGGEYTSRTVIRAELVSITRV